MYTSLCLLGDLFPAEWPPPQARRGAPHPPPTHRPYRIALCNALEPVLGSFKSAVAMAVQSESRVMRAVLVRLCARAAGGFCLPSNVPCMGPMACLAMLGLQLYPGLLCRAVAAMCSSVWVPDCVP